MPGIGWSNFHGVGRWQVGDIERQIGDALLVACKLDKGLELLGRKGEQDQPKILDVSILLADAHLIDGGLLQNVQVNGVGATDLEL